MDKPTEVIYDWHPEGEERKPVEIRPEPTEEMNLEDMQEEYHRGAMFVEYSQFPGKEFNAEEIRMMTGQNYDYGCWLDGIAFLVAVERNPSGLIEKASLDIFNGPYPVFRSCSKSTDFADVGRYAEKTSLKQE